jgi:hypothetical protein
MFLSCNSSSETNEITKFLLVCQMTMVPSNTVFWFIRIVVLFLAYFQKNRSMLMISLCSLCVLSPINFWMIEQIFMKHHHHLHGSGHVWSVPSSWKVRWYLHLKCGRPVFNFLLGCMLGFPLESMWLAFIAHDISIVIWFQNFNLYASWCVYHGTWPHLNSILHKSLPSVIVYPIVARQQLSKHSCVAMKNCWRHHFLWGLYLIKGK